MSFGIWIGSRLRRVALVLAVAGVLAVGPGAARANWERIENEAGLGAASALCSLFYGPAKLVYAGGGALIAGLAWAFAGGDSEVASPILNAALRGDYVVTPQHLRGERPLEFVGRDPADRRLRESAHTGF